VSLKNQSLSKSELAAYEATRDLAAELLQSVREMKAGHVQVVSSPVIEARKKTGLSQSQFAAHLACPCVRRRGGSKVASSPVVLARTLLAIASTNPKALLAVAGK
jgi:putative transcriptional regulator